jgi:hypothetical protein
MSMCKFIASIVLASIMLPQIAAADALPRHFHGHWCGVVDDDKGMRRVSKPCMAYEAVESITVHCQSRGPS